MKLCIPNPDDWKYHDAIWLVDICGLAAGIDLSAYRMMDAIYLRDLSEPTLSTDFDKEWTKRVSAEFHAFLAAHSHLLLRVAGIRSAAESALRGGSLKMVSIDPRNGHPFVKISEFTRWAETIGLEVPQWFYTKKQKNVIPKKDILASIKSSKSEAVKKMLRAAHKFHDDNGHYPNSRELFDLDTPIHGYSDWESFRKTFIRYFSETG